MQSGRVEALWKQIVATALSLFGLIIFVGCGSSGNGAFTQTVGAVTIKVNTDPTFPTIIPGSTVTITATVIDASKNAVVWTLNPIAFGSLSDPVVAPGSAANSLVSTVTYTAPASFTASSNVVITATSITNPAVTVPLSIAAAPTTVLLAFPLAFGQQGPSVPASDQTLNPGDQLLIQSEVANAAITDVTWTLSPDTGAGTLVPAFPGVANYIAPSSVSEPVTVTIMATSSSTPSATGSTRITVLPSGGGPNVAVIHVDGGPVPGQVYQNGAFINGVTICNPGQPPANNPIPTCQTVDGILVDTGSYGLRILQSAIPLLKLPNLTNGNGNILENCYAMPDSSYLWGPVAKADVYIGGESASTYTSASGIPNVIPLIVQVISSKDTGVPLACSNGLVANRNTQQLLGANGILGIGPEPYDCSVGGVNYCDGSVQLKPPNVYFSCPKSGCADIDTAVVAKIPVQPQFGDAASAQQVGNPIPLFQSLLQNPFGAIISLPPVSGAETKVNGTLTFATSLPGATIHTLDSNDHFTTILNGTQLTNSFIDSGSNALFFPDILPTCAVSNLFFCPLTSTNLSAVNAGATQGQTTVDFTVDNADSLFSSYPGFAAFGALAGSNGSGTCAGGSGACTFDWGFPFFYGRSVFTKIDQCSSAVTSCTPLSGAYYAY
jgi:hypothetical protein